MVQKSTFLTEGLMTFLKNKVEQRAEMSITKGNHCKQLSEEIFKKLRIEISYQSLRRFFGFIDQAGAPNLQTLDILAKYCGYDRFEVLINDYYKPSKDSTTEVKADVYDIVFNISFTPEEDSNYHYVCGNLAQFLYDNPKELTAFPMAHLQKESVRQLLIERFPFIDLIEKGYKPFLEAYRENTSDKDAHIFANTLLYLTGHYTGHVDPGLVNGIGITGVAKLHPFLQGRVMGSHILKAEDETRREKLYRDSLDMQEKMKDENTFPHMTFTLFDYLYMARKFEWIIECYKRFVAPVNKPVKGWVQMGYMEVFEIYYAAALARTGDTTGAGHRLKKLKPKDIAFFFRKTYSIPYYTTMELITADQQEKDGYRREAERLMDETKFRGLDF